MLSNLLLAGFRLKTLKLPVTSAFGKCNITATDGQHKALIHFDFESNLDIGDEFIVELSVVKSQGDLLSLFVKEQDNVKVFDDKLMSEEFDIDELEYPPL